MPYENSNKFTITLWYRQETHIFSANSSVTTDMISWPQSCSATFTNVLYSKNKHTSKDIPNPWLHHPCVGRITTVYLAFMTGFEHYYVTKQRTPVEISDSFFYLGHSIVPFNRPPKPETWWSGWSLELYEGLTLTIVLSTTRTFRSWAKCSSHWATTLYLCRSYRMWYLLRWLLVDESGTLDIGSVTWFNGIPTDFHGKPYQELG